MPVICCTSKLLADIDDPPLADFAALPTSPLGDWYGHLFSVDRRKCIIFINEPTLFVCPAFGLVKADYRHIKPFFIDVLTWTLDNMLFRDNEKATGGATPASGSDVKRMTGLALRRRPPQRRGRKHVSRPFPHRSKRDAKGV